MTWHITRRDGKGGPTWCGRPVSPLPWRGWRCKLCAQAQMAALRKAEAVRRAALSPDARRAEDVRSRHLQRAIRTLMGGRPLAR